MHCSQQLLLLATFVLTVVLPLAHAKKCPNATLGLIEPCICTYGNGLHTIMDLDCSQVSDGEELQRILGEDFPNRSFRHFNMRNSPIKILPKNLFGNHQLKQFKFETIDFSNSALEEIQDGVFSHMTGALLDLNLSGCQFASSKIIDVESLEVLVKLQLQDNLYTSLDPIKSASLVDLTLGSSNFAELPEFTAWDIPQLQTLDIRNSPIQSIPPNSFNCLENLHYLSLINVGLRELTTDMITWSSSTANGSNAVGINLDDNDITAVQPGAIQGSLRTFVSLRNNKLTALEEDIWKPILDLNGSLDINGIPLPCGCDMAWAMNEINYMYQIYNGVCADGTHFINLNPMNFVNC